MKQETIQRIKRKGTAMAFLLYPLCAGVAFAVHPNLLDMHIGHDITHKIAEFHGNDLLHFGHFLMVLSVPMLIVIALHLMGLLEERSPWLGFIGGVLAVTGAIILALDKAALCMVPSAFDTLPEAAFQHLTPGIEALFQFKGWLWVLWLLPLLPVGFVLQTIGLERARLLPRWQSSAMLIGSVLMANPDIDIIGLIATIFLTTGFIPYAFQLWNSQQQTNPQTTPAMVY
jgi:hypothetical protein